MSRNADYPGVAWTTRGLPLATFLAYFFWILGQTLKEVLHSCAEVGGRSGDLPPPTQQNPLFSSTNRPNSDLSSKNQTLDQRGHFPLSESKNENLQAEESLFEFRFGFGSGAFWVRFPM